MGQREDRFLRVLAEVDLPGRWAALVASGLPGPPADDRGGIDLYRMELLLDELGVPFKPKEYDDEDYWPMSRVERFADHGLILRISSPDGSEAWTRRLDFAVEIILYDGERRTHTHGGPVPRLVVELGGAEPQRYFWFQERAEARRAAEWLIELARDVAARTTQLDWSV